MKRQEIRTERQQNKFGENRKKYLANEHLLSLI